MKLPRGTAMELLPRCLCTRNPKVDPKLVTTCPYWVYRGVMTDSSAVE